MSSRATATKSDETVVRTTVAIPAPQPARKQKQTSMPKQPNPNRGSNQGSTLHVSPCVSKYALALEAPWYVDDVCLPSAPSFPSQKIKAWCKGIFATGTGQVGYVGAAPWNSLTQDGNAAVFYTTGSYGGTGLATSGAGVVGASPNTPYLSADFSGTNLKARVVASGLRFRYVGTELNKAGKVVVLEEPTHADMTGFGPNTIYGYANATSYPVDRNWRSITYTPVRPEEVAYQTNVTSPPAGVWTMVAYAWSPDPSVKLSFEFEYWCHLEYLGFSAQAAATASEADPYGFELARTASQQVHRNLGDRPDPDQNTFIRYLSSQFYEAAATSLTYVGSSSGKLAIEFARSAVSDFISSRSRLRY